MKLSKIILITTLLLMLSTNISAQAFGSKQSAQSQDVIIPAAGIGTDESGKPDIWISVPKRLRPLGTPIQNEDDKILLEPKNKPRPIKEMFNKPEGFDFRLQQPSIKVGG